MPFRTGFGFAANALNPSTPSSDEERVGVRSLVTLSLVGAAIAIGEGQSRRRAGPGVR